MSVRRRIGLLVPAVNATLETDFQRMLPDGVSLHTERLWHSTTAGPSGQSFDHLDELNEDLDRGARYVARVRPSIVAYGCTSGSFFRGAAYDENLRRRIGFATHAEVVSTTSACVSAFATLGITRLTVASPYGDWVNGHLRAFLEAAGLDVLAIAGEPQLKDGPVENIDQQEPDEICSFVRATAAAGSQGIFLACTAWRAADAVAPLERELGIPVIAANSATIWQTFAMQGLTTRRGLDGGRLLASLQPG